MIRVSRDGKEIGEYSTQDALRLLSGGTLRNTDHYWQQGMADWALLAGLKATEEVRIKNDLEAKSRNEKAQAAERLQREKADLEAKSRNEKALAAEKLQRERAEAESKAQKEKSGAAEKAEAARIQSEKQKANNFQCHCCRESFPRPFDPTDDFVPATWSFFQNVFWLIIPIIGWILGTIGMWRATIRMLASGLHLPSCPKCRSVNFSRPQHDSTFYPLLPIGVAGYFRSSDQGWIGGVCSGFAHYTGFHVGLVRIVFCFGVCPLLLVYLFMWQGYPKRPTKGIVIP